MSKKSIAAVCFLAVFLMFSIIFKIVLTLIPNLSGVISPIPSVSNAFGFEISAADIIQTFLLLIPMCALTLLIRHNVTSMKKYDGGDITELNKNVN